MLHVGADFYMFMYNEYQDFTSYIVLLSFKFQTLLIFFILSSLLSFSMVLSS